MRAHDPSGMVMVHVLPAAEPCPLQLGVIVPRSVCPTAVGRNRLRRLLRESIRTLLVEEPALLAGAEAVVLRWRVKPSSDCKRLRLRQVLPLVRAALEVATYSQQ